MQIYTYMEQFLKQSENNFNFWLFFYSDLRRRTMLVKLGNE